MRLIKMSSKDIDCKTLGNTINFFEVKLRNRKPVGKFRITRNKISKNGLAGGETLLFVYESVIIYHAKVHSGRENNTDKERETYPYFITLNMESLRYCNVPVAIFEAKLRANKLITKNIFQTQAWAIVDKDCSKEISHLIHDEFDELVRQYEQSQAACNE